MNTIQRHDEIWEDTPTTAQFETESDKEDTPEFSKGDSLKFIDAKSESMTLEYKVLRN